jgi:hypothetical protein
MITAGLSHAKKTAPGGHCASEPAPFPPMHSLGRARGRERIEVTGSNIKRVDFEGPSVIQSPADAVLGFDPTFHNAYGRDLQLAATYKFP